MKVCFWGNQDNNPYRLCKWMRNKGVDAHLYLSKSNLTYERGVPWMIDRDLEANCPDWIHTGYDDTGKKFFWMPKKIKEEIKNNFDILIASGASGLLTARHFNNIPIVSYPLGTTAVGEKTEGSLLDRNTYIKIISNYYRRKTIRMSKRIVTGYDPTFMAIKRIKQDAKLSYIGFPEDAIFNRQIVEKTLLKKLNEKYQGYDKVFLWLSRVNFVEKNNPAYKGTEKFLEAVEKLIKNDKPNIRIIVGEHGFDWKLFKQKTKEKEIQQYFDYVPHLPFWKLSTYLSIENVIVFDELVERCGELSGIAREAFCVDAITIKALNQDLMEFSYGPDCPIINATTSEEAYIAMKEVLSWEEGEFMSKKAEINKWAMKYLHWDGGLIDKFICMLKEIVYIDKLDVSSMTA